MQLIKVAYEFDISLLFYCHRRIGLSLVYEHEIISRYMG